MQFVGVEKKQKWDDKLGRSRETRVATLKKDVDGEGWFKSQLKITSRRMGSTRWRTCSEESSQVTTS